MNFCPNIGEKSQCELELIHCKTIGMSDHLQKADEMLI